ncbi:plasmid replication initiation protein [Paraburkholderia tropica]|uniref:replication initiator protein A n=1 Tax=Paraburkholderia tropica TaxID=92647 RepID=UPI00161AAC25|nr:replication initiator protein A [Paraburkholderia tropica]MBB3005325.1 plasmid replication initiation protein [Paraburkholderia tropica]
MSEATTRRAPRRTRTYLSIDYDKREHAKRHGGLWDKTRQKWYVLGDVPAELLNYVDAAASAAGALADLKRTDAPRATPVLRTPPSSDRQTDLFVHGLYDVSTKDAQSVMDVAVFRLSKKDKRAGEVIRHELPDGYVEVSSGPAGMASVWDYDIVLMAVSHLADAMNQYRAGKGSGMPSRMFRPHASDILKFCRRGDGGKQASMLEGALDRLKTTNVKIVRSTTLEDGEPGRSAESQGLISDYRIVSSTSSGRIGVLEIEIPRWIYAEVTRSEKPGILTVSDDYFLIEPGIGRFLYRLARRAAGTSQAKWSFRLIYERSASTGTLKKFTENLRKLIAEDCLPEYSMAEEAGKEGPLLVMTYRTAPKQVGP